jgi:hypothetical protein
LGIAGTNALQIKIPSKKVKKEQCFVRKHHKKLSTVRKLDYNTMSGQDRTVCWRISTPKETELSAKEN